jgi:hypothetical protein
VKQPLNPKALRLARQSFCSYSQAWWVLHWLDGCEADAEAVMTVAASDGRDPECVALDLRQFRERAKAAGLASGPAG